MAQSSGDESVPELSESAQETISKFGESDREKLKQAFANGESGARGEFEDSPSRAFSRWHRGLQSYYTTMDVDWLYYRHDDHEPYLFIETITVPEPALGESVDSKYPLWDHKQAVLENLHGVTDKPTAVVWHAEACDRFFVKEISQDDGELCELVGDAEYADWLDEYRLNHGGES